MSSTADILAARARLLARPIAVETELSASDILTILVIGMGEERMGIPVEQVVTVVRPTQVTPLPRTRFPVRGVTAWRGRPLTVFWLSMLAPAATDQSRYVVLGDARRAEVAVLADFVDDVRTISRASLVPPPGDASALPTLGVSSDAILVLDPVALLRARTSGPAAFPDRMRTS